MAAARARLRQQRQQQQEQEGGVQAAQQQQEQQQQQQQGEGAADSAAAAAAAARRRRRGARSGKTPSAPPPPLPEGHMAGDATGLAVAATFRRSKAFAKVDAAGGVVRLSAREINRWVGAKARFEEERRRQAQLAADAAEGRAYGALPPGAIPLRRSAAAAPVANAPASPTGSYDAFDAAPGTAAAAPAQSPASGLPPPRADAPPPGSVPFRAPPPGFGFGGAPGGLAAGSNLAEQQRRIRLGLGAPGAAPEGQQFQPPQPPPPQPPPPQQQQQPRSVSHIVPRTQPRPVHAATQQQQQQQQQAGAPQQPPPQHQQR